jgi:Phosphoribosylformimino-5-aminoimidazole carboxamide ribonucleotide (ProFAR) isomerase
VIISGGVSSIDDLVQARGFYHYDIGGLIVGSAFYDGDILLDVLVLELDAFS